MTPNQRIEELQGLLVEEQEARAAWAKRALEAEHSLRERATMLVEQVERGRVWMLRALEAERAVAAARRALPTIEDALWGIRVTHALLHAGSAPETGNPEQPNREPRAAKPGTPSNGAPP